MKEIFKKICFKILTTFYESRLSRNTQFKNLHNGEECYIIGNGKSLKNMDLKMFNDKISIGCNSLFVHKDFPYINCRYYQIPASMFFLKYRYYNNKLRRNYLNDISRRKISENKKTNFFTSLTNINYISNNVYYEHHYGHIDPEVNKCDISKIFSFMNGSLVAMVGLALYMGFKKAKLVGVDYTFVNPISGHFFEKGELVPDKNSLYTIYKEFFNIVQNDIELETMTIGEGKSYTLKYESYSDYFNVSEIFQENHEIIERKDLDLLDKLGLYTI